MHINLYLYINITLHSGILPVYFIRPDANKPVEFTVHSLMGNLCQTSSLSMIDAPGISVRRNVIIFTPLFLRINGII